MALADADAVLVADDVAVEVLEEVVVAVDVSEN